MVRGALSALLGLEPDIEVVGEAADGEEAWRLLQQCRPDVFVTDIEMPGLTGLELAQRAQRHELSCKVVILTTFARPGFLRRALEAPMRQIAENSSVDGGVVVDRSASAGGNIGFDAARKVYVDLFEAGIVDPAKVVRVALENAVSVASVLLLTEATMTDLPEKEPARPGEASPM